MDIDSWDTLETFWCWENIWFTWSASDIRKVEGANSDKAQERTVTDLSSHTCEDWAKWRTVHNRKWHRDKFIAH